ncbi:SUKH-4 family immunity protein [Streptomyces sp. NPDC051211]|uniref:SUKH-4 family immunity protein n=1 Tax=Streptomyces sp. NPDC051211 TaxID=3154643 RepID=UPI00344D8345
MRFRPVEAAVTVARLVEGKGDPALLEPGLAGRLAVGHLRVQDWDAEHVVLDPVTGRLFSLWLYEERPDLSTLRELAPSPASLGRLLGAVEDLGAFRGRFAELAGQRGPAAVARAEVLFRSVLAEEDWGSGGIPRFWELSAVIRPLSLIAGPGDGLRLELPGALLVEEFGAGEVVRVDPARLPAGLVHEPTRRFLAAVGLPRDGGMFYLDGPDELLTPFAEEAPEIPGVDTRALFSLGGLVEDTSVYVDGVTGAVHAWYHGYGSLVPLNSDVSTLAFTLWLYRREQALEEVQGFTDGLYGQLADTMVDVLAAVDPVPGRATDDEEDWHYWPQVFHDEAGGVL